MHRAETIFALSSGRVPSAIAVVRVSGPQAAQAVSALVGRLPAPRVATRALLRDAQRQPIDDSLVLWFPGPASATGEDIAEFQVHGGRAVLQALFAALLAITGIRPAEPGEFTRRAFENGKLDLTEAEALDDLIHADTDRQRRQALRQLQGLLGDRVRDWREQIIGASALIEAGIDFADEADVPTDLVAPAVARIQDLLGEIEGVLASQGHSERLRDGLVVTITGPPNVGKSTLINQLARREVAIVSPFAGTTRDLIEVQLDLEGYPVMLVDTAGIRETDDPIEQEGVRRARHRAAEADLILWLDDGADAIRAEESSAPVWVIRTKTDLIKDPLGTGQPAALPAGMAAAGFAISAKCGEGLTELMQALVRFAADHFGHEEGGLIGRARQRQWLEQAADALRRCLAAQATGEELIAEELRMASDALGRLLGRVDVEDVLDVVFRDFCIGK